MLTASMLPQVIKRHIYFLLRHSRRAGRDPPSYNYAVTCRSALVNGKPEECRGRGRSAGTCHRYLVSPFGIATGSVSHRLADGKKQSQRNLARDGRHKGSPVLMERFNPRLISCMKPFCPRERHLREKALHSSSCPLGSNHQSLKKKPTHFSPTFPRASLRKCSSCRI